MQTPAHAAAPRVERHVCVRHRGWMPARCSTDSLAGRWRSSEPPERRSAAARKRPLRGWSGTSCGVDIDTGWRGRNGPLAPCLSSTVRNRPSIGSGAPTESGGALRCGAPPTAVHGRVVAFPTQVEHPCAGLREEQGMPLRAAGELHTERLSTVCPTRQCIRVWAFHLRPFSAGLCWCEPAGIGHSLAADAARSYASHMPPDSR
jgi:hypothetical protein